MSITRSAFRFNLVLIAVWALVFLVTACEDKKAPEKAKTEENTQEKPEQDSATTLKPADTAAKDEAKPVDAVDPTKVEGPVEAADPTAAAEPVAGVPAEPVEPVGEKGRETVMIQADKGEVEFLHWEHQAEIECATCHHTMEADGGKAQSCKNCHGAKDGVPSMEKAAHTRCKGCHKGNDGPIDCDGCHEM
ncbi:MAG: hypothetical protein AUK47_17895 [Deltaproteobacteria bacterium CG2_30_63_29]|nr:MAG: hypothetical protein AUK47_17895 [Deltaproteobacteria bacterium CG2_30_63_29]PJB44873.1 MAG: hypothetical protein CO108_08090 [Deltaproteobacteria bacterium CG_4_9_14_3_um_filter_63_12]